MSHKFCRFDATVKNLSTSGAMLQVESILDIPNEFTPLH